VSSSPGDAARRRQKKTPAIYRARRRIEQLRCGRTKRDQKNNKVRRRGWWERGVEGVEETVAIRAASVGDSATIWKPAPVA